MTGCFQGRIESVELTVGTQVLGAAMLELRGWAGMFHNMEHNSEDRPKEAAVRLVPMLLPLLTSLSLLPSLPLSLPLSLPVPVPLALPLPLAPLPLLLPLRLERVTLCVFFYSRDTFTSHNSTLSVNQSSFKTMPIIYFDTSTQIAVHNLFVDI